MSMIVIDHTAPRTRGFRLECKYVLEAWTSIPTHFSSSSTLGAHTVCNSRDPLQAVCQIVGMKTGDRSGSRRNLANSLPLDCHLQSMYVNYLQLVLARLWRAVVN